MNEKGNFWKKLRLRWQLYLENKQRRKEKKKKEEMEIFIWQKQNGVRPYSKPQVFFLTCFGLFVGIFEKKAQKNEKLNLKSPTVTKICTKDTEEIQEILIKVEMTQKKIPLAKDVKELKNYQDELISKKKRVKALLEKYPDVQKEKNVLPIVLMKTTKTIEQAKDTIQKIEKIEVQVYHKEKEIIYKQEKEKIQKAKLTKDKSIGKIEQVKKEKYIPLDQTQILTSAIKESGTIGSMENPKVNDIVTSMELDSLYHKITATTDVILLNQCIETIHQISIKTDKKETCTALKKQAELKKEELLKKQKIKARTERDLNEILLMETLIYNHVKKQKKELKKFKSKIDSLQVSQKRIGIFSGLKRVVRNAIKLAFSMFPMALFKNKKIGILTSAIFVNNGIRSMRRAVTQVEIPYLAYENIASQIRKAETETEHTRMICYDSLDQIHTLKQEFLYEVGHLEAKEVDAILKEMNQLEKMIESRTKELEKVSDTLVQTKEANKQKVKKLENMYNK